MNNLNALEKLKKASSPAAAGENSDTSGTTKPEQISSRQKSKPLPKTAGTEQPNQKRVISLPKNTAAQIKSKMEKDLLRGSQLGLNLNRFNEINKDLDGLQDGFYLIGARENAGKTALLCNLFIDTLESNQTTTEAEKPVFGLFFSLDDTKNTILNRFIAILANGLLRINDIAKPKYLNSFNNPKTNKHDKKETVYTPATDRLLKLSESFYIFDSEEILDINDIEHLINLTKAQHPDKKIVVFIDSIFNLELSQDDQNAETRQQHIARAQQLKQITKTYSLPLVCTVELRKEIKDKESNEAPATSAIMESGKYSYNADLVFMLWYNKEQLSDLKAEKKTEAEKDSPVQVTLTYAKNKLSECRAWHTLNFKTNSSLMEIIIDRG